MCFLERFLERVRRLWEKPMRYRITNAKGEQIAQYNHESEVKQFLAASLPPDADEEPDDQGAGELIYFDKDEKELFRVRDTRFNRA